MSQRKAAIACVMVLALVATLCFGCAGEEEEKITIVIGNLTDQTGVAASVLVPIQLSLDAHVKYVNEEEPIPGVELKTIRYDTRYDPARAIPGYNWLRDRGAKVIYTEMSDIAELLITSAARDKVPVVTASVTEPCYEPPGWVFCLNQDAKDMMFTVMQWISDQWEAEGKPGKPRIGTAGWSSPYGNAVRDGAEGYCLDHPDKFDYAGSYMAPTGVVTWAGEVAALKDCDYVVLTTPGALQPSTFAAEFRGKGYDAKFVGLDSLSAYWDFMLDVVGSEEMDGALIGQTWPLWVHPAPIVDYLKDLAYENHPDKADSLIYGNCGWISGGSQAYLLVECVRQAIEAVGAENFDGQAFYDAAISFSPDLPGFEELGWTPTERRIYRYIGMYEYSHAEGDFVVLQDWVRVIEE